MEYYSPMKKKEILSLMTTWVDLEGIILRMCETDKNKTCMLSLINEI